LKSLRIKRQDFTEQSSRSILYLFSLLFFILAPGCEKDKVPDHGQIRNLLSHRSLGLAYLEENQLDKALTEFKRVIEIAPDEALGHANLALTYLRKTQYQEAEKHARKALELSREPEIHLIYAEVLERTGKPDAAITELQHSVKAFPNHIPSQYKLAQLHLRSSHTNRYQKAETNLLAIEAAAPANLVGKLHLTETLVRNGKAKEAILQLREIRQLLLALPAGAEEHLTAALKALDSSNPMEALPSVIAFHNFLKPTPVYQAGIFELSGSGGPLMGFPVQHFSSRISIQFQSQPLSYIRFVQASEKPVPPVLRIPADSDNDGKMEMCEIRSKSLALLDSKGKTIFEISGRFSGALFFDFDQDGDLDLYGLGDSRALRNNGDGTFTDRTGAMGLIRTGRSRDAAIGDFDDDGDLDLFVVDPVAGNTLYTNMRQGLFRHATNRTGLTSFSEAVTVADYDHDGALDIFVTGRRSILFRNKGNGVFQKENRSAAFERIVGTDAAFIDFDNDGFQDLIVTGERTVLLRNIGRGVFKDVTAVLPPSAGKVKDVDVTDVDSDGDLDLLLTDPGKKQIRTLRNDGGNANQWLKVTLAGLGTGSGKNNRNGIGARLEIKAGDLYQMRVVTEPVTHFGLGLRKSADVLRVVWTNGVPQNHMKPQSNQIVLEKQILKGSCPFVYAWNGEEYEFVTDIMWKSGLGMPLGIMAGSTAYAFPNSSDEYLRIASSQLKARDGFYTIQITEELWETAYIDKSRLLTVDHPDTVEIFIDEKFVVPPFPPLQIYPVAEKIYPISATDDTGSNVRPKLLASDDHYVGNLKPAGFQGITEEHDLILNLGRLHPADRVTLFLRGWIFPSDASINIALSQSTKLKPVAPYLQVPDQNGKWQTVIPSMSFPMGKNKTMIVDLSGKFLSNDHRVRIRTSMEIYWDEIFYTKNEPSIPLRLTTLNPVSADLHYRGFSRMYRKNVLGPHWFDYADVNTNPKWRDLEGNYTRFGDVTPLLQESDSQYVIFNAGDEITIRFDVKHAPELPKRWTRDFLLYSDGWIKDGDLNTAHSKTVEPLPFQGIHSYPYSAEDRYPTDRAHQEYLKTYNTRFVKPNLKLINTETQRSQGF
jgi:Tfp pilus assembly protein PilF